MDRATGFSDTFWNRRLIMDRLSQHTVGVQSETTIHGGRNFQKANLSKSF